MSSQYQKYGPEDTPEGEEGDDRFVGVNQRLDPDKLPAGMLADCVNGRMRTMEVVPRLGLAKPGWLNVVSAADDKVRRAAKLYGVGVFRDPNSRDWVLTAADGGVFRHRPHNGRFGLSLPTGVKLLGDCTFVQAFGNVYLFRGKYLQPLKLTSIDTGFADLLARWSASTVYTAAVLVTGQVAQEMAYGPFQSITSLTSVADKATVVTTLEHGYITGADVTMLGAVEVGYNGRWNIVVVDSNTFTYQFPGAAGSPATGTPKVSNNAYYYRALGSRVTLTGITRVGAVATATKAAHGFSNGQYVTVTGADQVEYNVTAALISGVTANTFDYPVTGAPVTPATGATILARTSVVLAGQSPDTNPEAWQRIYNVLPNADDAVFVNNRLLVATAYTPGATDYDSTSTYTKKDFLVGTDIGDDLHFDFSNEFRINQGGSDEIVCVVKMPGGVASTSGTTGQAVVVLKGNSWGVLSGVALSLGNVSLDMKGESYGACSLRGAVIAGDDVLFAASQRGVMSLEQNELGQVRSVDVPFSNDVSDWVKRINWGLGAKIKLAYWDDKLFVAVPLDDGTIAGGNMVPADTAYIAHSGPSWYPVALELGKLYEVDWGNALTVTIDYNTIPGGGGPDVLTPTTNTVGPGRFTATTSFLYFWGSTGAIVTGSLKPVLEDVNNAVLVYDYRVERTSADAQERYYRSGQWASLDQGPGLCVKEWFKAIYNGVERLFFVAEDGWVNLMEECEAGDQIESTTAAGGLGYEEISTRYRTRGYRFGVDLGKKHKRVEMVTSWWNGRVSVTKRSGAQGTEEAVFTALTFSRTKYLKPAGRADYVAGNASGDFDTAGRGDYSVDLSVNQAMPLPAEVRQEVTLRSSTRTLQGRYVQFEMTSDRGRVGLKSCTPTAQDGNRRGGVTIG